MVSAIIGWDNDLTSYDKEVRRGAERGYPIVQNLVSVLAAELGHARSRRRSHWPEPCGTGPCRRFLRLRDEWRPDGSSTLARTHTDLGSGCGLSRFTVAGRLDTTDPTTRTIAAVSNRLSAAMDVVDTPSTERPDLAPPHWPASTPGGRDRHGRPRCLRPGIPRGKAAAIPTAPGRLPLMATRCRCSAIRWSSCARWRKWATWSGDIGAFRWCDTMPNSPAGADRQPDFDKGGALYDKCGS